MQYLKRNQQNIDLNKFKSNIEYLEDLITIGKLTEEDKKLLISKKHNLKVLQDQIYHDKVKGAYIRSHSGFIEEGKNEGFYRML